MERYFEINESNQNIQCKLYYDKIPKIKKIVVFCHGFAGHKDNGAAEKFAAKVLSKYKGIAVLTFNLPCHGDDVKKKLILQDSTTYLGIVIDYVRNQYNTKDIYAYATSFGGYLVLKYIIESGNPFTKIALRCPAVNMYDVLTNTIMKADEYEKIQRGKSVLVGFDRKIEVDLPFLKDLQAADIQKMNYLDYADDIRIIHGTKDEVVPFEAARKFSDDNLIELIPVDGADHRFQNPKDMDFAIKNVLAFFSF